VTGESLRVAQLALGAYRTNCYLAALQGRDDAVVVDPGDEPERVMAALDGEGWNPVAILLTHTHEDHIGAVHAIAEATGAEVWMPRDEADVLRTYAGGRHEPDHLLDGGEVVSVAGIDFGTLLVPGHSDASIAYFAHGFVFSGDVLFSGSIGRTDFAGGSHERLIRSITELCEMLPPETVVLSGHGPITTLETEIATNPFLAELRS
jgi:hydroxyacylglutathione hydrolase